MTTEANAQAGTPAAPAEGTIAPETTGATTAEQVLASEEAEQGAGQRATETTNSTGSNEQAPENAEEAAVEPDETETEEEDGKKPKQSRSARYKRKIEVQAARIAELERLVTTSAQPKEIPKAPKPEDFNYDQVAYEDARAQFHTQQSIERALSQSRLEENQRRLNDARAEMRQSFQENIEEVKPRIPDFDEVIKNAPAIDLRQDISDLILSSEKGGLLAYDLAKHPDRLRELNGMTPTEAARYIGRLEARLSLPQPKKQTQAPAPIKPPSGGASPTKSAEELADNMDEYMASFRARQKKRA